MEIKKQTHLSGELTVPGDKSISHRAVMFGSLAQGTTKITHFLEGADCLSTISCFRKMGIDIERNASEILVHHRILPDLQPTVLPAGAPSEAPAAVLLSSHHSRYNTKKQPHPAAFDKCPPAPDPAAD